VEVGEAKAGDCLILRIAIEGDGAYLFNAMGMRELEVWVEREEMCSE